MTTTLDRPRPLVRPSGVDGLLSTSSYAVVSATVGAVAAAVGRPALRSPRPSGERSALSRSCGQDGPATDEQSRALAAAVAYAVRLVDPDAPCPRRALSRLAREEVSLGVRPEHYTLVGHHLLALLAGALGDAATPEVAAAWGEAYWLFVTHLLAEEARLYAAAGGPLELADDAGCHCAS